MGIQTALQSLHWPLLLTALAFILSTSAYTLLTKLVMSLLLFRFPLTLSLIHTASISISLFFWSLFGLFKLRKFPLKPLFRLALPTALTTLLNILSLRYNSLLIYQSVRMLTPSLVHLIRHLLSKRSYPNLLSIILSLPCSLLGLFLLASLDHSFSTLGLLIAFSSLFASVLYHLFSTSLTVHIRGTELQYQLALKTATAICILPLLPFFEHTSSLPPDSLYDFIFDEGATLLILSTGLLAFFSFAATRAAANRMTSAAFNNSMYIVAMLIFFSHFLILEYEITFAHMFAIALVLLGYVLPSAHAMLPRQDMERSNSCSHDLFRPIFPRSLSNSALYLGD